MRGIHPLGIIAAVIMSASIMPALASGYNGSVGELAPNDRAPASAASAPYLPLIINFAGDNTAPPVPSQSNANCLGLPAYPEVRTNNTMRNQTPGQPIPASQYQGWNPGFAEYQAHIDGQGCLGTTEQILEWAAKKWGFADMPSPLGGPPLHRPDLAKAMAVTESDWRQWVVGDYHSGNCDWTGGPDCPYPHGDQSFGIISTKRTSWPGSYPYSTLSTAFAADYAMAAVRHHYDGNSWLPSLKYDLWRAVEAWYSGKDDASGDWYQTDVRKHYAQRTWRKPEFQALHP